MMNEDASLKWLRERYDNPPRPPGWEPEPESKWLFLDEEQEGIEGEYGRPMREMREGDLMGLLDRFVADKREWLSAAWSEALHGIRYTYPATVE